MHQHLLHRHRLPLKACMCILDFDFFSLCSGPQHLPMWQQLGLARATLLTALAGLEVTDMLWLLLPE
jgi:hypothetical protein